jgi:hypothetical protein
MRLITPRPAARCFDHFGSLTPTQAKALRDDGFEGCFCYVSELTATDLQTRLGMGLWVGFLLEGLAKTTMPTRTLGSQMANAASTKLRSLSVPQGPTIFADLESEGGPGTAFDWIAFGTGAGAATATCGDMPGAYVAEGIGLTSAELYALPAVRYWKGRARILDRNGQPAAPLCDWAVIQGPINFPHPSGVQIDFDTTWEDYRGRSIVVVAA